MTPVNGAPDLEAIDGHQPYVPDSARMPEFTWQAVIVGALLGIVFGASSLYLVLKVGITVSASIPVAVLSITLFRAFSRVLGTRKTTILENNIVQTTGSAGESIAFGVGVTMPALLLIGFEIDLMRVMVVSILGGVLGILMMIPLRRAFIVNMHGKPGEPGKLLYPEGTACAQVLISGEKGGTSGLTVLVGFGIAFLHKFLTDGMNVLRGTVTAPLGFFSKAAAVSGEMASELLGVGYIIGLRISAVMMAGAVLGWLVLAPTLFLTAEAAGGTLKEVYGNIRFIGAGCVAAAGIISMCRTMPMIVRSFSSGLSTLRGAMGGGDASAGPRRTEDDLPPKFLFVGCFVLLLLLTLFLQNEVGIVGGLLGSALVLVFGFLFVTVSSRLTGEIGSSSNPISGMTVATLLLTCLIFLALGRLSPTDAVLALSIGGVVCIAASNGGTTSQDLKTGFLLGGTPRLQQWAIIVGALTSALVIGLTLLLFNSAGTIYTQRNLPTENVKDELSELSALPTQQHDGETFHVWMPQAQKGKKYLVDTEGRVVYRVDPTITGGLKQRDEIVTDDLPAVTLKKEELQNVRGLKETMTLRQDGKLIVYLLWKNAKPKEGEESKVDKKKAKPVYRDDAPEGEYLVNEKGAVVYRVTGTEVKMKFEAPKTQVMGIIINGLLDRNLNWSLVLIGAFIAVTLELCGVSSLAFAVGVYVPMKYSMPIFLGGLVRWAVDAYAMRQARAAALGEDTSAEGRARAEVAAIAKTESSPGVLLSSGLIAGGSLAGVMLAFFEFSPALKEAIDFGKEMKAAALGSPYLLDVLAVVVFLAMIGFLALVGMGLLFRAPPEEDGPRDGA